MPEAIVAIIIISLFCGTVLGLTGMILKHRRSSKALGSRGSDSGILTSELKQMMREAAAEATAPLEARIEELQAMLEESAVEEPHLLEAARDDRIEFEEADGDARAQEPVSASRRVR